MADGDASTPLADREDRGRFTPDNLITRDRFVEAALAGRKDQVRRNDRYADPGERFDLDGVTFAVTDVFEQRLGDMDDADARREGFRDLEQYRDLIRRVHEDAGGGSGWDEDNTVVVHEFERVADGETEE
ncbi:MAG: ASCH domain-containing protein [Halobacteriaceae archaeon]